MTSDHTDPDPAPVLPGAEPLSHDGAGPHGALVLHGFTGNPSSMRGLAEAFVGAGFHVEMPRLPGHGTVVEEMLDTRWDDWTAETEAAFLRLASRSDKVVVVGLSMGGTLALWAAVTHPDVAGVVCVNPAAQPQPVEVADMLRDLLEQGVHVMPGIGSDIADPSVQESAYEGTPVAALLSLLDDGVGRLAADYQACQVPMLLLTSRQDHVVDPLQSDYLADAWGGDVERLWLDRSYHVATQDFDRDLIETEAVAFALQVTA